MMAQTNLSVVGKRHRLIFEGPILNWCCIQLPVK